MSDNIILNKEELAITKERQDILEILEAGIRAALPDLLINNILEYDFSKKIIKINNTKYFVKDRIFIAGIGKASALMAKAVIKKIGSDNTTGGLIVVKSKDQIDEDLSGIVDVFVGDHPFPDKNSLASGKALFSMKDKYSFGKDDVVLCLISGGGSALVACPAGSITLAELNETNKVLIKSGLPIEEINIIRKHISKIKGGQLANHFSPSKVISLLISDVKDDDTGSIASGLTAPDKSTFDDAWGIIEKFGLVSKLPRAVVGYIKAGVNNEVEETPKKLNNCDEYIIASNKTSLQAMSHAAGKKGYNFIILEEALQGSPKEAINDIFNKINGLNSKNYNLVLAGGETTPKIPSDHGVGGRNQQFISLMLKHLIEKKLDWTTASVGSDGSDFLKDAAGGVVDSYSAKSVKANDIDINFFIERFDSNTLLKKVGKSIIKTGSTGTNIRDLACILLK